MLWPCVRFSAKTIEGISHQVALRTADVFLRDLPQPDHRAEEREEERHRRVVQTVATQDGRDCFVETQHAAAAGARIENDAFNLENII